MVSMQTEGIVLKEYNFSEADKIFNIFTRKNGKVSCIAKGVRKSRSKMRGFLQPFTYSSLQLFKGKSIYTVTGGEVINSFPKLKNNLLCYGYANYIAEVLDNFLPAEDVNEQVFQLVLTVFHSVDRMPISQLFSFFVLKLLRLTGFLPEFYCCLSCGKALTGEADFAHFQGGCFCPSCKSNAGNLERINIAVLRFMQGLLSMDVLTASRLKMSLMDQYFVEALLGRYLEVVLEKPINSRKFIEQLRQNGERK
ncbi:MAG: DNA repair protein RecO [Bacillota bacterium]